MIDDNRKLAHIVAYYLSRFDKIALNGLGYRTNKEAFTRSAASLGLLPNYIKFRRDDFDVVHPHRKGWHKRKLSVQVINTIVALQDLDEPTVRGIVQQILDKSDFEFYNENIDAVLSIFPLEDRKQRTNPTFFASRIITGRKAESYFLEWHSQNPNIFPESYTLTDTRDHGCGYDFELLGVSGKHYYVEVKGLATDDGGILFTNKEWEMAKSKGNTYYLVLISNMDTVPSVNMIQNPALKLTPKKSLISVVQVSWKISLKDIQ